MTIFDFINDILYKKSGSLLTKKGFESEFQPYMINKWLSMRSDINVRIIAVTTNKMYKAITDKREWYKLFIDVIPKTIYKRFTYIKKTSNKLKQLNSTPEIEHAIEILAEYYQLSIREVREYVEDYGLDITDMKKIIKQNT